MSNMQLLIWKGGFAESRGKTNLTLAEQPSNNQEGNEHFTSRTFGHARLECLDTSLIPSQAIQCSINIYIYRHLLPPKLLNVIDFQENDRFAFLVLKFQPWCYKNRSGLRIGFGVRNTVRKAFKTRSQTVREPFECRTFYAKLKMCVAKSPWCSKSRSGAKKPDLVLKFSEKHHFSKWC